MSGRIAALLTASILAAGCSTTTTVLRREQYTARFRVTSDVDGAAVLRDGVALGQTPTQLQVRYTLEHKQLYTAERKQGWWMLGTGLAAMATGAGVGVWGFSGLGDTDADPGASVGKVVAGTYAVLGAIYGLYGLIAGIYYLHKNPADIQVQELTPQQVTLGLELPGEGLRQARLTQRGAPRLPGADRPWLIRYSGQRGRWEARLPEGLQLVDSTPGGNQPTRVGLAPPTALPAPPAQGSVDEAPTPGKQGLVQDLRSQGEACYRQRDYRCALQKFERAFALQATPAMRFNVASTLDKLGRAALAVRQYRRYLDETGASASPSATAHIQKRMKSLLSRVAQLQLTLSPTEAGATLDGVPLSTLETGAAGAGKHQVVLDPGTYRLDVTLTGYLARSLKVTLTPGELRALEVKLVHATGREDEP